MDQNRLLAWLVGLAKKTYVHKTFRRVATTMLAVLTVILLPYIIQSLSIIVSLKPPKHVAGDSIQAMMVKKKLETSTRQLEKKLLLKIPRSCYLVINTAANEFSLYKGNVLIRQGKCSTGSYILLKNGDKQEWMFKTPKGELSIQGKTTSPVWRKPDWAFVEEGLPIPAANHSSRHEYGVLGDYALSLGQGYLIHGTLYQRFLGLPVTHGCIRLNDENLELVYSALKVGSKVYIY